MSEPTDSEVVVVTGASAGVGRATARAFAERGAKIGLLSRGEDGLEGAREDVEEAGGEAVVVPTDVSDFDEVNAAAETVENAFGPIDIWVNNAMVSVFSPAAEMTAEDYRRVTEVTYLGYVHGTQVALERMRPATKGRSCRSAPRWRIGVSRCNRPIAARNTRSRDLPSPCGRNSSTTTVTSSSRWYRCPR